MISHYVRDTDTEIVPTGEINGWLTVRAGNVSMTCDCGLNVSGELVSVRSAMNYHISEGG